MAAVLPFLERVNVVSFHNTDLADEDIAVLGEGLSKGSFRILKLSSNHLTDAGAATLAQLLAGNKTVEELDVSSNQIGDAGATALADLLTKTLRELRIEGNKMGDAGVAALCLGLQANPPAILRFGQNSVGDEGAAAIGALLKSSTTIIEVQLGKNNLTNAGVAVLCEALKANKVSPVHFFAMRWLAAHLSLCSQFSASTYPRTPLAPRVLLPSTRCSPPTASSAAST